MKKIKLLYTINYLTNGGPTRVLQNIIYGIPIDKYDVYVLTIIDKNNYEIVKELKNIGISVIEINLNRGNINIILNKNRIIDEIKKIDPDIIHVHGIEMSYVVSRKQVKSIKLTTIHNCMYEDYKYSYGKVFGKIVELLHISWLKKFNENICCSETSYNYLSKKINNVSYIRNGVVVHHNNKNVKSQVRKELGLKNSDIVYVYGGVVNSRKRVLELVKMFCKTNNENEYLLIVGDGPLLDECKKNANDKVKFVGFKNNIIDYFDASDIYVSYSSAEGFSISLIEAFSSGLLCLISDIPSHKECFNIDKNYYIGEFFDKSSFDEKKKKVLKNLNSKNSARIRKFQKEYLSSESMSKKYCDKYDRWLN